MGNFDVLKYVMSFKTSFIAFLSGLFLYLFWVNVLGRDMESVSDGLLIPFLIIWFLFLAASVFHVLVYALVCLRYVYKRVFRYLASFKESRDLKQKAGVYMSLLNEDEGAILYLLLTSPECTARLSLHEDSVRKLLSLGFVIKKRVISYTEIIGFLDDSVVEVVRESFIPVYFDNARQRFDKENPGQEKLVRLFYEGASADEILLEDVDLNYLHHFDRFDLIHLEIDREKGEAVIFMVEYFSMYLEKLYGEKPKYNKIRCKI